MSSKQGLICHGSGCIHGETKRQARVFLRSGRTSVLVLLRYAPSVILSLEWPTPPRGGKGTGSW
jgi:hypothetical protein